MNVPQHFMLFIINAMCGVIHDVRGRIAVIDVMLKTGEVAIAVEAVAKKMAGQLAAVAYLLVPESGMLKIEGARTERVRIALELGGSRLKTSIAPEWATLQNRCGRQCRGRGDVFKKKATSSECMNSVGLVWSTVCCTAREKIVAQK